MLAALCEDTGRSALVVCAGEADATRFAEDTAVFGRRAEVFPARDYVLRPVEGQSHEYEYRRLAVLGNLVGGRTSVACAPVEAVLQYTTPKQEFCGNTLTVKQGMAISMDVLIERLFGAGYLRRFQVDGPGPVFGARRYCGYLRARHAEAPPPGVLGRRGGQHPQL